MEFAINDAENIEIGDAPNILSDGQPPLDPATVAMSDTMTPRMKIGIVQ